MKQLIALYVVVAIHLALPELSIAHPPWGIAVDSERSVYFPDISRENRGAVWKLTDSDSLVLLLSDFHAHSVQLDENENVIATHAEEELLMVRLGPDGSVDTLLYREQSGRTYGSNILYSPSKRVLFIDSLLKEYVRENDIAVIHPQELEWSQSMLADANDNIYVPDLKVARGAVYKLSSDGSTEIIADRFIPDSLPDSFNRSGAILGMTIGCDSLLYVCETINNTVVKVEQDKRKTVFYSSPGNWFPVAIDFFAGDAYIMEYKFDPTLQGPRIVRVSESGQVFEEANLETRMEHGRPH